MTPAALAQLQALTAARKGRDLARLDLLLAEDRALAAEISALGRLAAEAPGEATGFAALVRRLAWVDQRRQLAERRRAALAMEIATARAAAIRSLGKHRALEHLGDRAKRDASLVRAARAEREAPPPKAQDGS